MSHRAAAVLALTAFAAAVVALIVEAVDSWPVMVVGPVSLSVAVVGGWLFAAPPALVATA